MYLDILITHDTSAPLADSTGLLSHMFGLTSTNLPCMIARNHNHKFISGSHGIGTSCMLVITEYICIYQRQPTSCRYTNVHLSRDQRQ
jgi:hypothetical protein